MMVITSEFMKQMVAKTRPYTFVILKSIPKRKEPGADKIVWEHARRNFSLRAEGKLSIVCPMTKDSGVSGIGIFNADPATTRAIIEADPGVTAGIFTYEIYPCQGFPGDALP